MMWLGAYCVEAMGIGGSADLGGGGWVGRRERERRGGRGWGGEERKRWGDKVDKGELVQVVYHRL